MTYRTTCHTTRRMIASFALLLTLGGAAVAQSAAPAPALKASVTVTGDVVRIGDLVENAGPVADVPIFRAPDLGTSGAVATDRIVDAIRPHQLIGVDTRGLAQVTVTRASRPITEQEISSRITAALAGQYGLADAHNILVRLDGGVRTLQVEPDATGELQVIALSYDPRTTRFDVTFDLPTSAVLHQQASDATAAHSRLDKQAIELGLSIGTRFHGSEPDDYTVHLREEYAASPELFSGNFDRVGVGEHSVAIAWIGQGCAELQTFELFFFRRDRRANQDFQHT